MYPPFSVIIVSLIPLINCSIIRGQLNGVNRAITFNGIRSNIEHMNEHHDHYHPRVPNRIGQTRYNLPISYWPFFYSGFLPNNNMFRNVPNVRQQVNSHSQPSVVVDRFPNGLTYEVTKHINYDQNNDNKKVTTAQSGTANDRDNTGCISKSSEKKPSIDTQVDNKDSGKISVQSVDNNKESVEPVQRTLEAGPDVMMSDSVQNNISRSIWKREIKSGVPLDVLLDGTTLNITEGETNVSEYLTNLFEDLDQDTLLQLISTLKDEYLSTATPAESKIIEDTFKKLTASLSNTNKHIKDKIVNKRTSDGKQPKSELIAEAAAVLELLAEESSIKDTSDSVMVDEGYDYYGDMLQEDEEDNLYDTSEPSFLELVSIATKRKATKSLINDKLT